MRRVWNSKGKTRFYSHCALCVFTYVLTYIQNSSRAVSDAMKKPTKSANRAAGMV